jgi:hypothetical protein
LADVLALIDSYVSLFIYALFIMLDPSRRPLTRGDLAHGGRASGLSRRNLTDLGCLPHHA